MSPVRRRRPLLRAAAVGGGAYMAGKAVANRSADREQQEAAQDARISDLEAQQDQQTQYTQQPQYAQPAPAPQQAAPPAAAQGTATPGLLDQLNELAAMHERGALTDDEFSAAKARLLG